MPALIERPKMSLAMWAALKSHIMKQREKKKQEQEADAAVERLRREQEMKEIKRKQDAMTIEEMNEQISELQKRLLSLKDEKHELFLSLKRVLNDDEVRRNEEDKDANNDGIPVNHPYANQNVPVAAANLYLLGGSRMMNRNSPMYKIGTNPPIQQNGALKRQRSPSPQPNPNYSQGYNYKSHVAAYGQTYSIPHPSDQYPAQDQAKHLSANYHVTHLPQTGFVAGLPPQIEHQPSKPNMQDEKYYIQQTGSISAGYPIRSQPQLPSHLPTTSHHSSNSPHQSAFYQKVKAIREYQRAEGMAFEHVAQNDPNAPIRKEDIIRRNMNSEMQRTMNNEVHRNMNSEGHRNMNTEAHRNMNTEAHRNMNTESHRNMNTESHRNMNAEAHRNMNTEGHRNMNPEGHRNMNPEGHRNMNPEGHRNMNTEGHRNMNTEGHRNMNTEAHRNMANEGHRNMNNEGHRNMNSEGHR